MAKQRKSTITGFSWKRATRLSAAGKLPRQIGAAIAVGVGIFLISTTDFAAHAAPESGRTAPEICAQAASETLKGNVPTSIQKAILSVCETAMRGAANYAACDAAASKIMKDLGPLTANTCKTAVRINSED